MLDFQSCRCQVLSAQWEEYVLPAIILVTMLPRFQQVNPGDPIATVKQCYIQWNRNHCKPLSWHSWLVVNWEVFAVSGTLSCLWHRGPGNSSCANQAVAEAPETCFRCQSTRNTYLGHGTRIHFQWTSPPFEKEGLTTEGLGTGWFNGDERQLNNAPLTHQLIITV